MFFWRMFYNRLGKLIWVDGLHQYVKPEDALSEFETMQKEGMLQPYLRTKGINSRIDKYIKLTISTPAPS